MIDDSPLTVARGVARGDFLMVPAEVIEKKIELGAEVQQPRVVSRRLAGRHASHSHHHESILPELALSKKGPAEVRHKKRACSRASSNERQVAASSSVRSHAPLTLSTVLGTSRNKPLRRASASSTFTDATMSMRAFTERKPHAAPECTHSLARRAGRLANVHEPASFRGLGDRQRPPTRYVWAI